MLDVRVRVKNPQGFLTARLTGTKLVGGFNPFEKYARQNGNLPQFSG